MLLLPPSFGDGELLSSRESFLWAALLTVSVSVVRNVPENVRISNSLIAPEATQVGGFRFFVIEFDQNQNFLRKHINHVHHA